MNEMTKAICREVVDFAQEGADTCPDESSIGYEGRSGMRSMT